MRVATSIMVSVLFLLAYLRLRRILTQSHRVPMVFEFRWLRRLVRRNTRPMSPEEALTWKKRFSIAYMIIGWNVGGFVLYMCMTGRSDWPTYYGLKTPEEAQQKSSIFWAEKLGVKNARVMSFKGLSKVEDFEYENPENRGFKELLEEAANKRKQNE